MTRILLLINRLADHGGAEVSTGAILEGLQGEDTTFDVVTLHEPADLAARDDLVERGATFTHLAGRLPQKLRALSEIVATRQPDVIHATLFHAELLAAAVGRRHDIPVIFSMVNTQYDQAAKAVAPSPRKLEIVQRLDQLVVGAGATHLHAISESVADHLRTELRVAPGRITVVPRGRSRTHLGRWTADRRNRVRAELGLEPSETLIVNVGRHERQKGQDLLLDAIGRLQTERSVRVLVAGREGNETSNLRTQQHALGLHDSVSLLGARSDVADLLCAADLMVCTSRYEGLGGALIEAMALELPVIAFDLPITREVLGPCATFARAFDSSELAQRIDQAIADRDAQNKLAAAALDRFEEHYAIESTNEALAQLYRRVAGRDQTTNTKTGCTISVRPISAFLENPIWDGYLGDGPDAEYFLSSTWQRPWFDLLAGNPDAAVVVATRDGVDVAALPLAELRMPVASGRGSISVVTFAGSIAGSGDYFDIIHDGSCTDMDAAAMLDAARTWTGRRTLRFSSLTTGGLLDNALAMTMQATRSEPTTRALIDEGAAWDDIKMTWSKNRRKKIRQKRERFEELGGRFEWIEDADAISDLLPAIFDLHLARMNELDRPSAFIPDTAHRSFHEALAHRTGGPGRCWAQIARIEDEIVGILYGFAIGGNYYVYQSGWRPGEDLAEISMGLVQYAEGYHNVVAAGGQRYDMLRGTEDYKSRFATTTIETNWYEQRRGLGRVTLGGLDLARDARKRFSERSEATASP